jgi:hypothetical protein
MVREFEDINIYIDLALLDCSDKSGRRNCLNIASEENPRSDSRIRCRIDVNSNDKRKVIVAARVKITGWP